MMRTMHTCARCKASFERTSNRQRYCSRSCRDQDYAPRKKLSDPTVRYLKVGERVPDRPADGRYMTSRGYVRLRWRMGKGEYVEAYEHQIVAGSVTGMHVHHRNHDRSDNRPENLELLTPQEHYRRHGTRLDVPEAVRLYEAGLSTLQIGRRLKMDPAQVWRVLKQHGVQMRPQVGGRHRVG